MQQHAAHFRPLVLKAVEIAGSQTALAVKIGRSQQQISALCTRAETISAEDAMAIEQATGGAVKAADLRPDLPWPLNAEAAA